MEGALAGGALLPLLSRSRFSTLRSLTFYLEGLSSLGVAAWGLVELTGDTRRFLSTRASRSTR